MQPFIFFSETHFYIERSVYVIVRYATREPTSGQFGRDLPCMCIVYTNHINRISKSIAYFSSFTLARDNIILDLVWTERTVPYTTTAVRRFVLLLL